MIDDGRTARTIESRNRLIEANLALLQERADIPSPEEVAERAGLSRRTLFRLFPDLKSLQDATREHTQAVVAERYPPPTPEDTTLAERITALVDHRSLVYEFIGPLQRLAQRYRLDSAETDADLRQTRRAFRQHLETLFKEDIDRKDQARWHALEVLTSWQVWMVLRQEQGLSVKASKRVLGLQLQGLFDLG